MQPALSKNPSLMLDKPSAHPALDGSPEPSAGRHDRVAAIRGSKKPTPHSLEFVSVVSPVNMSPGPSREEATWRTKEPSEQIQGVQIGGPSNVRRFRPAFRLWYSPWVSPWHSLSQTRDSTVLS